MNKKTITLFVMGLLIIIMVFTLGGCKPLDGPAISPTALPMTIGYCPTMKPIIQHLIDVDQNLSAVQYDNAAMAIQSLMSGTVQAVLIGRVARQSEINEDISLNRIEDGYTLIAQNQAVISYESLRDFRILTLEENEDASSILPQGMSITYYPEFSPMFSDLDASSAILLRWSEVPESFQLLIPVDEQGNKVPAFRSPHFYYNDSFGSDISKIIDVLSIEEACPLDLACPD